MKRELVDVELLWKGNRIRRFSSEVAPDNRGDLYELFVDAIGRDPLRHGRDQEDYEIRIRIRGKARVPITYTGRRG
ncbi:hypothetical protein AB0J52_00350 [Spirillospora sp. NPDC049652]